MSEDARQQTTRARAALEAEPVTITRAELYDMQQEIDDLKAENARLIAEGTKRLNWLIGLADHAASLGRKYAVNWHVKDQISAE